MNKNRSHIFGAFFLAVMVALVAGCAGTRTSQSTGEFIDDAALTANVKSALLADKVAPGLSIEVESFKGRVQLSGFVDTNTQKRRAEEVASGVKGVREVINNITIKTGGGN